MQKFTLIGFFIYSLNRVSQKHEAVAGINKTFQAKFLLADGQSCMALEKRAQVMIMNLE